MAFQTSVRALLSMAAFSLVACSSSGDLSGSAGSGGQTSDSSSGGASASGGASSTSQASPSGGSGGASSSSSRTPTGGAGEGGKSSTVSSASGGTSGNSGTGGSRTEPRSSSRTAGSSAGNGGSATGGTAAGGTTSSVSSSGGSTTPTTSGGTGVPGNYPIGNAPVKSPGCGTDGKAALLTGGSSVAKGFATSTRLKITSNNASREFIIDIPADYDNSKPYRFFYTSHWIGSTDTAVATGEVSNGGAENWGFYGLHRESTTAKQPAIFAAPQSVGSTWQETDNTHLFDDILKKVSDSLCIDMSRVFATGFSFGGMITYSLSTNHQKSIRAAVGLAPANYNIWLPDPLPHDPIAWMQTTGMGDNLCPWNPGNPNQGGESIMKGRAKDNGCTVPATVPTWKSGSTPRHFCYDFEGCKANYPTKACTFDGDHWAAPTDSGGENGLTSWIPTESWKFFTQF